MMSCYSASQLFWDGFRNVGETENDNNTVDMELNEWNGTNREKGNLQEGGPGMLYIFTLLTLLLI